MEVRPWPKFAESYEVGWFTFPETRNRTSRCPDIRTCKRPDVWTSGHLDFRNSGIQDIKTTEEEENSKTGKMEKLKLNPIFVKLIQKLKMEN